MIRFELASNRLHWRSRALWAAALPAAAQLNENCTVSILNRNTQASASGAWSITNVPAGFGLVRARATCIEGGQTRFGESGAVQHQRQSGYGF